MRTALAGLCLAVAASSCAPAATTTADRCDPAAFRSVRQTHAGRSEVTLCGTVVRVGRLHRSRSGTHRIFVVDAGAGGRVSIDANVDIMGNFPIRNGEQTVVRGEYYYDAPGRDGVHWTHRTDHGTHPPGYVELDGVTYR